MTLRPSITGMAYTKYYVYFWGDGEVRHASHGVAWIGFPVSYTSTNGFRECTCVIRGMAHRHEVSKKL
jgi:hypothetical protein